MPNSANPIASLSTSVRRLIAEITPMTTPKTSQMIEAPRISESVRGAFEITFDRIEFGANVLMFVPIGFFGALALARARWLILPAAVCASAIIETVQALRMPERVGTPADVIANSFGALLGYLLALVMIAVIRSRIRRRPVVDDPLPRDALALES